MSVINVLTYNVCWECIKGEDRFGSARLYGEICSKTKKINGKNLCFRNISKIVSSNSTFDIIGLQEANINLANNIIKKLGNNYKKIYSKSCKEYSIIIYNSLMFKKVGNKIHGFIEECGRPYLIQNFLHLNTNKSLIFGNFHGPHLKHDWLLKYLKKACKIMKNNCNQIIIVGDFNKELKKVYKLSKKTTLKPLNFKCKTSLKKKKNYIDKNKKKYNKAIDNIIVSSNIKVISGPETLNCKNNKILPKDLNFNLSNFTSDHRPVAAQILIN